MGLFGKKNKGKDGQNEEGSETVTTNEGDEKGGFFSGLFTNGSQGRPAFPVDHSDGYAQKGYTLSFLHLPSGQEHQFKAFLTQFSDSFSSEFSPQSAYGRMDPIYTFQQTTRQLQVGFAIPAFSIEEAKSNLAKVGQLARKLYPSYSGGDPSNASSLARAPLMRLRFANLIRANQSPTLGLLGKVSGFTFTPNLEHGFFDLPNFLYPKTIDVSFSFDPLHETVMGWTPASDGEPTFGSQPDFVIGTTSTADVYNNFPYVGQARGVIGPLGVEGEPDEDEDEANVAAALGEQS